MVSGRASGTEELRGFSDTTDSFRCQVGRYECLAGGLRGAEVAAAASEALAARRAPAAPALASSRCWPPGRARRHPALTITAESASQLSAPRRPATFAGSLTGMVGTYLALIMVLLVSRIPFIERVAGQDGLVRLHRALAPWPISLLAAHALFLTVGYAQAARTGLWHEAGTLVDYPDVLIATVALGIMCFIGVISLRAVRRRLPRDTWWLIHLWMYLALALAVPHELVLGPSFVGHPLTRLVWSVVWAATAGAGALLPDRPAHPAHRAAPVAGGRGATRRARRGVGDPVRPAAGPAAGIRRAVPVLAVPDPGPVVAGAPVLAVRAAAAALPAADRQGGG